MSKLMLGNDVLPDDPAVLEQFQRLFGVVPNLIRVAFSLPPQKQICATAFDYVPHARPICPEKEEGGDVVLQSLQTFASRNRIHEGDAVILGGGRGYSFRHPVLTDLMRPLGLNPTQTIRPDEALANFLSFNWKHYVNRYGESAKVLVLDIGEHGTSAVIGSAVDGSFQCSFEVGHFGGFAFTKELMSGLDLSYAKSDHLKKNATKSPEPRIVFDALKPIFNQFTKWAQSLASNVHEVIILGGGANMAGLKKFLQQNLGVEVSSCVDLEQCTAHYWNLHSDAFNEHASTACSALGLALEGLNIGRTASDTIHVNISSSEIDFSGKAKAVTPVVHTTNGAWGIDVGSYALKAVRLSCERGVGNGLKKVGAHAADNIEILTRAVSGDDDSFASIPETLTALFAADEVISSFNTVCSQAEEAGLDTTSLKAMRGTMAMTSPIVRQGFARIGKILQGLASE